MATINLLPTELTLKGKDKNIIEGIKKLAFIGFLVLIVASLVTLGYLFFVSLRIRSSLSSEEVLKQEISSFQQAEQGLFLIKDRISKIKNVPGKESANDQISTLRGFLQNTQGEFNVLEIQISSQKTVISLTFPSSGSFGNFYKVLVESKLYPNIVLKSFSFNPSFGYLASFELSEK